MDDRGERGESLFGRERADARAFDPREYVGIARRHARPRPRAELRGDGVHALATTRDGVRVHRGVRGGVPNLSRDPSNAATDEKVTRANVGFAPAASTARLVDARDSSLAPSSLERIRHAGARATRPRGRRRRA